MNNNLDLNHYSVSTTELKALFSLGDVNIVKTSNLTFTNTQSKASLIKINKVKTDFGITNVKFNQ